MIGPLVGSRDKAIDLAAARVRARIRRKYDRAGVAWPAGLGAGQIVTLVQAARDLSLVLTQQEAFACRGLKFLRPTHGQSVVLALRSSPTPVAQCVVLPFCRDDIGAQP